MIKTWVARAKAVRCKAAKGAHKPLLIGGGFTHLAYCVAAFLEGHGAYAVSALGMGAVVALGLILGEGEGGQ